MRRHGKKGEHENLDRWLLTYADMITLLMAFFIMMYSMSILNLSKFKSAAISIRSGFNGAVSGQGKSVLGTNGRYSPKPSPLPGEVTGITSSALQPLVNYIRTEVGKSGDVAIGEDTRGVVITMMSDRMLFDSGSAEVKAESHPLLDKIAETLDHIINPVMVEGHTCDLPPRGSKYPTNWELSTARATNVLRYMVERKGLDAARFSAAGYSDVKPVLPNTNEMSRRRNRRVEIVILRPEPTQVTPPSVSLRDEIRRSDY